MIKEFVLKKGLGYAGKKLDGYKMKIGGFGSILMGLLYFVRYAFPDLQEFPEPSIETGGTYILAGITALGWGHKMEKQTAATVTQTAVIEDQTRVIAYKQDEDPTGVSPRA